MKKKYIIKKRCEVFSKNTDAWSWLEKELKNVPKENIIDKKVKYNENCGDADNTASYSIKIYE